MNKLKKAYEEYSAKLDEKFNKIKRDIVTLKAKFKPLADRFDNSTLGKKWQNVNPFHTESTVNKTTNIKSSSKRERDIKRSKRNRGPQI